MASSSSVNTENLRKKLNQLSNTQDSVQALSYWIIHHKNNYRQIVDTWLDVLKECKSARSKLSLLYLVNDVIQNSKRKGTTVFVDSFKNVLEEAASHCQDNSIKKNVLRLFKIWGERSIYEEDFCAKLNTATGKKPESAPKKPPKPKVDAKFLAEFQPEEVPDKIEELATFEDEVEFKYKQLSNMNLDVTSVETISQLKDRAGGKRFSQQFEDAADRLEEFVVALDKEVQLRTTLVDLLEKSEIFYDAQMGEAKIVANAYKNFATRVTSLKKRLDDYKKVLPENDLSPLPSPTPDAPSPGATPPQEADGVNRDIEDMDLSDSEDGGKIIAAVPAKSHSSRPSVPSISKTTSVAKKRPITTSNSSHTKSRSKISTASNSRSVPVGEKIPSLSPKVPVNTAYKNALAYRTSMLGPGAAPGQGSPTKKPQVYTPSSAVIVTTQNAASYSPASTASYTPVVPPKTLASYNPTTTAAAYTPSTSYTPTDTTTYTREDTPTYVPSTIPATNAYVPTAPSVYAPPVASLAQAYTPTVPSIATAYTPTDSSSSATQQYGQGESTAGVPYTPTAPAIAPVFPPPPPPTGQAYTPPVSTVPYTPTVPPVVPVYTPSVPPVGQVYNSTPTAGQEYRPPAPPIAPGQAYTPVVSSAPAYSPSTPGVAPTYPQVGNSLYMPSGSMGYTPAVAPEKYPSVVTAEAPPPLPPVYDPSVPPPPPDAPVYSSVPSPMYTPTDSAAYNQASSAYTPSVSSAYNPAASSVYTPTTTVTPAPQVPAPYEPPSPPVTSPSSPPYNPIYSASYSPILPAESNRPAYSYTDQYSRSESHEDSYDTTEKTYGVDNAQKTPVVTAAMPEQNEEFTRSGTPTRDENSQSSDDLYEDTFAQPTQKPVAAANPMQFLTNLISRRAVASGEQSSAADLLGSLTSLAGVGSALKPGLGSTLTIAESSSKITVEEKSDGKRVTSTNAFGRSKTRKEESEEEEEFLSEEDKHKIERANQAFGVGMLMMQLSNDSENDKEEMEEMDTEEEKVENHKNDIERQKQTEEEAPDFGEAISLSKERLQEPLSPWTSLKQHEPGTEAKVTSHAEPLVTDSQVLPAFPPPPPPPPPPAPPTDVGQSPKEDNTSAIGTVPFAAMLLPPPPPSSGGPPTLPPPPPPPPQGPPVSSETPSPSSEQVLAQPIRTIGHSSVPPKDPSGQPISEHVMAQPIQTIGRNYIPPHPSGQPIGVVGQMSNTSPSPPPSAQPIRAIIGGQRISVVGQQRSSYRHHEKPRPVPVLGQSPRMRIPGPPPGPPPPTAKQLSGSGIRVPGPPPGPPPVSAKRMLSQESTLTSPVQQQQQPIIPVTVSGPPPADTNPIPNLSIPSTSSSPQHPPMDTMPISVIPSLVSSRPPPLRRPNLAPEVPPPFPRADVKPLKSILKRSKTTDSYSPNSSSESRSTADHLNTPTDTDLRIPVIGGSAHPSQTPVTQDEDFRFPSREGEVPAGAPISTDTDQGITVLGSQANIRELTSSHDVDLRKPEGGNVSSILDNISSDTGFPVVGAGGAAGAAGNISPRFSPRQPIQGSRPRSPRSPGSFRIDQSPGHDQEHKPFIKMDYGHGKVSNIDIDRRRESLNDSDMRRPFAEDIEFDKSGRHRPFAEDSGFDERGHQRPFPNNKEFDESDFDFRHRRSLRGGPRSPRGRMEHHSFGDRYPPPRPRFDPDRMGHFDHHHRPEFRPRGHGPRFGGPRPNFRGRSPHFRPRQPFYH